jgi:hypothetical protein
MFRSATQLAILGLVLCGTEPHTVSELARLAGVNQATAWREVDRLRDSGVVEVVDGPGRTRLVQPAAGFPLTVELRRIVAHTGGLIPMLQAILEPVAAVEQAYIFGSWARRYAGEPGWFPHDVDLAIVGWLTPFELPPIETVARELNIDINPVIFSPDTFDPSSEYLFEGTTPVQIK